MTETDSGALPRPGTAAAGDAWPEARDALRRVADLAGLAGAPGPAGPRGEAGPAGPRGEAGPAGPLPTETLLRLDDTVRFAVFDGAGWKGVAFATLRALLLGGAPVPAAPAPAAPGAGAEIPWAPAVGLPVLSIGASPDAREGGSVTWIVARTGPPPAAGAPARVRVSAGGSAAEVDFETPLARALADAARLTPGASYDAGSGVLTLTDAAPPAFAFTRVVRADEVSEGTETITVTLSDPRGCALGTAAAATALADASRAVAHPGDLPQLALWLDAGDPASFERDAAGRVVAVRDKSANAWAFAPSSPAAGPLHVPGGAGGRGCWRFDGQQDLRALSEGAWRLLDAADRSFTLVVVASRAAGRELRLLSFGAAGGHSHVELRGADYAGTNLRFVSGEVQPASTDDPPLGAVQVWCVRAPDDVTQNRLLRDAVVYGAATGGRRPAATGTGLSIGAQCPPDHRPHDGRSWRGDVHEVALYVPALGEHDEALLRAAMARRHATPAPAAPPPRLDLSEGWEQTFADDFGAPNFDVSGRAGWQPAYSYRTETGSSLPWNNESQWYVDPTHPANAGTDPFGFADGVLTITADHITETVKRAIVPYGGAPRIDYRYSSGALVTRGWFAQQYGYFEARIQGCAGRGLWPAFWLLASSGVHPPEIDVTEILGHAPGTSHTTVHTNETGGWTSEGAARVVPPTHRDFHLYGVDVQPDLTSFYFDRIRQFQVRTRRDFHQPMYLLLNLAVGGNWPGQPDADTPFPARMRVDWVRAWRKVPTPRAVTGPQPEAAAVIAAMAVPPDAARAEAIHALVRALKAHGLWEKLSYLGVHAAHHEQAARLDWKAPARIATATGTLAFAPDRGFRGDGGGALDTGWRPAADGVANPTADNHDLAAVAAGFSAVKHTLGAWTLEAPGQGRDGTLAAAGPLRLAARGDGQVEVVPCNGYGRTLDLGRPAAGHLAYGRNCYATQGYADGRLAGEGTALNIDAARPLPAEALRTCQGAATVAAVHAGALLTPDEVRALHEQALAPYLRAVGAAGVG